MTGGALGNAWLAGSATIAATVEMWRAWVFGPVPDAIPTEIHGHGAWRVPPRRPDPIPESGEDLFFAVI